MYLVLLLVVLVLVATPLACADVFDGAEWIRDPVFADVPVIDQYHKAGQPGPEPEDPQNVHTFFRKKIELAGKPVEALLYITGDDYYKLYLNGKFVVQGPEAGYPFVHPYYKLDVTTLLQPGVNSLASHAYYQGLVNRVWNSGDNRSGFMIRLDVTYDNGRTERFVTDDSWRCFTCQAFVSDRTMGYKTQFAEDIDLRAIPAGWRDVGFDDSGWDTPLVGRQDHVFVEQPTAPVVVRRVLPKVSKRVDKKHHFFDFGTEITGHTRIRTNGRAGHRIEVRHGEELSGPDTVRYEMRANCVYQEFPVLTGGDDLIEFYDYRAFRYVEILNAPKNTEIWVDVRHHPFNETASRFTASDELLTRIWDLCKNGVRYGSQGIFVDCPSREKGQYLGDTLITSRSHLILTGDETLSRKAIRDFQQSQRICPGMMAVAPGSLMQEFVDYSLEWPMLLRDYLQSTGDTAFAGEMADAAFDTFFAYFEAHENDDGLLVGGAGKPILVDWPKNLRDDYDLADPEERENAVVNALYYASYDAAADVLEWLGRDAAKYRAKAEQLKQAFVACFLDAETGLFVDARGSTHHSLHANALPLAFGLAPEASTPAILELIREKRLSCGVYIAPFVIEACYRAGDPDLAYDLITSKDEHSWHEMLKHGATTCMEAWSPDQKWNTSWCHPWSSSTIYLITEYVMGLTPAVPGWGALRFAPHMPGDMASAEITIPTPPGAVTVRYAKDSGYNLVVPRTISVVVDVPPGTPVRVNGASTALSGAARTVLEEAGWQGRVGSDVGVWVSVDEQRVRAIKGRRVVWQASCSTAANGTGSESGSFKTPLGWHSVARKVGEGTPWGQVFRSAQPSREVWGADDLSDEDLVLTRILRLTGEEPGKNQGGRVDSYDRRIYIHGTNWETGVGSPISHGCVRLRNDDVLAMFDLVEEGTKVLITETGTP